MAEVDHYEKIANQFEIRFLEVGTVLQPRNVVALEALAFAYTSAGEYHKGLAIDRKLVAAEPGNPMILYNLACSLSLVGEIDECLQTLELAIAEGYEDWRHMERDPDLLNARRDPRYGRLRNALRRPFRDTDDSA